MEAALEAKFYELLSVPNVTGAILSDERGLCLLTSPTIKEEAAGILAAIAQHAAKIEDRNENPIINFEGDTKQCLIKKAGGLTTSVFKRKV